MLSPVDPISNFHLPASLSYTRAVLRPLVQQLARGNALSDEQIALAVDQLAAEHVAVETKAEFLTALARKGESAGEIAAFARELLSRSLQPPLDPETRTREILDVCGTGGDRLNTFNISTTVSFVLAASGVTVAKHGNRAITSQAGSADVLEALGVRIDLRPDEAASFLREHHFAFFFAPSYHPAFKHIGPARKLCAERGHRTVFNFLGPLLNPARPSAQLIGVPSIDLCEPMARVLKSLGVRRGMVVCGSVTRAVPAGKGSVSALAGPDSGPVTGFLDELSTLGETQVAEFYQDRGFMNSVMLPGGFPLQPATLTDLAGSDRQTNADIVRRLLRNQERGPKRDAILLNAAAALFVAGKTKSIVTGWDLASDLIDSGKAEAKLDEIVRASR